MRTFSCTQNKVLYLQHTNKRTTMQIISPREFRANQKKYFDMAERETIFVARKNARPILISVADDADYLSKAELQAVQQGLEDIQNGRTTKIKDINNIWESIL